MLEEEMADLVERFQNRAQGSRRRDGGGWSLVTPVWDARGRRMLGWLRVESGGAGGKDIVTELEESPFAQ